MRRIIETINNGNIDRSFGTLTFSVNTVEHSIRPGTVCEGSFSVVASSHALTEGYVISDDYRMECITTEFTGVKDEIAYRFHGENSVEGSDVRGSFILLTNRGEYRIPFDIHVEGDSRDSSLGQIRNIFHFTNLAKAKWDEALEMFYDPGFVSIFTGSDREYLPVYRCLSGVKGSERNMDEFLISIRKKTPVEYLPSERSIELSDPEGVSRYELDIIRNGWGYTHFKTVTEGDFLSVEEREVTADSFLGNRYRMYYYVDSAALHTGHNFGSIALEYDGGRTVIPVTVTITGEHPHLKSMNRVRMHKVVSLMDLYEAHRLKKISTKTWLDESAAIVEEMLISDPEDLRARLYNIHLMITRERNNEALWNLRTVKDQASSVRSENSYLWCYYLYLNSLVDDGDMDIATLTEEVEYCYRSEPDNWRLCWLLSVMSDEYSDAIRRWKMFEDAYKRGCNSPAIYLEAARIVTDNPTMITSLEGFDMRVIRYMCKKNLMNDELALVIRTIAENTRDYSQQLVRLLTYCYRDYPNDDMLTIICSQLIKAGRTDSAAHEWYSYGVKQQLKITRLYEFFMMSMDLSELTEIPRIVLMYFSFQSDLDYETNAYLYAYVLKNRHDDPEMYSRYIRQITDFVTDQLRAGHNNRYLALLYRNLIDDTMLEDPELASKAAGIVFMHEVDTTRLPGARYAVLCYAHRDGEFKYPVNKGRAVLPIVSDDYCVALEDDFSNRYAGTVQADIVRLIPPGRLLLALQMSVKDDTSIDANICMERGTSADVRPENEFRFRSLLEKGYFSREYAQNIAMKIIRFYHDSDRIGDLDAFLGELRAEDILPYERPECIRFLIGQGQYDKALDWIGRFGPEGIDRVVISNLLSGYLPMHRDEADTYGRLIPQLLLSSLESGRINLPSIQYLMERVQGEVRTLRDVWNKAHELDADCRDLSEKILIQIMFTGGYIQERARILQEYADASPDPDVLRAVLTVASYEYFVEGVVTPDAVFDVLGSAFENGGVHDRICDLAFVRHYAENRDRIDDRIRELLKASLHRLLADGVVISCFRELSDLMPSMTRFADAVVIEYRTVPGTRVSIHYIIESDEDDYHEEPMNEVYRGVYSRMFTVFFGERILYYITEDSDEENGRLSESNTIIRNDMSDSESRGRFGLIDDMCIGRALKDYATVDQLMEEYYRKDYVTGRLFAMRR